MKQAPLVEVSKRITGNGYTTNELVMVNTLMPDYTPASINFLGDNKHAARTVPFTTTKTLQRGVTQTLVTINNTTSHASSVLLPKTELHSNLILQKVITSQLQYKIDAEFENSMYTCVSKFGKRSN